MEIKASLPFFMYFTALANAMVTRCPSSSSGSLGVLYEAVPEEDGVLAWSAAGDDEGEACADDGSGPYFSTSPGSLDSLTGRKCDTDDVPMSDAACQNTSNCSEDREHFENSEAEFLMLQNKILHHLEVKRAELEDAKRQEDRGIVRFFLLYVLFTAVLCATLTCCRSHLRPWLLASTVQLYGVTER